MTKTTNFYKILGKMISHQSEIPPHKEIFTPAMELMWVAVAVNMQEDPTVRH